MRFRMTWASLCLSGFTLPTLAAPLETIHVNPPADTIPVKRQQTADADSLFADRTAGTLGIGVYGAGKTTAALYWGGLSHYDNHWYVSGRGFHAYANYDANRPAPNQDCCSDNLYEAALTVGIPLDHNHLFWAGTGISRLQRTRGDPAYDHNYVTASAPIELIFTNVRHPVGVEGRLIVDLAGAGKNYFGALFGLNFGG